MNTEEDSPTLWVRGRAANEVEKTFVSQSIRNSPPGKVLEVGAGTGRLLATLGEVATELYALDTNRTFLVEARGLALPHNRLSIIWASAERIPLKNQSMSVVVLLRVFHLLTRPDEAIREFRRVIEPGGVLVLSYVPRLSLKTFYYRLWRHLHRRADPLGYAPSRREFRLMVQSAGFKLVREFGTGFEEFPLLEHLPIRFLVRVGESLGRAPCFPTRIVVFRAA